MQSKKGSNRGELRINQVRLQPHAGLPDAAIQIVPTGDREAVGLMLDHKVGALPVLDSVTGDLVGILSYMDVLRVVQDLI